MSLAQAAEDYGVVQYKTVWGRLKTGWTLKLGSQWVALKTPSGGVC